MSISHKSHRSISTRRKLRRSRHFMMCIWGLGPAGASAAGALSWSHASLHRAARAAGATITATAAVSGAHTPQMGSLMQQRRGLKFVHPRNWILQWKLKPGDHVMVISGKWRGRTGKIIQTDKMRNAIAVEGVKERIIRDTEGREVQIAGLIHVSNAMILDPISEKPTRLALRRDDKGLPAPGPKDTPKEKALERTYDYAKEVATMDAIRFMMSKYNRDPSSTMQARSRGGEASGPSGDTFQYSAPQHLTAAAAGAARYESVVAAASTHLGCGPIAVAVVPHEDSRALAVSF
ncbi:ribosomal protein rpl24 [Cyclospora cayetanensis]|uniref:Large ribosomal subunit protein uL24c n=1 Tax=Cyclospora cayetanensis TaxID=88456 RepID=A0A1D3D5G1_9EIME|nr:ribosomal protein rpl24 [Cyclospora cayetanensis]